MSATADTWPDGRPKTRPGFNKAAWEGERPLAEPLERQPLNVGDSVAMREPVDANGDPVIRGIVLWVETDRVTGEQTVVIARQMRRANPDRRYSDIKWDYQLEKHPAELIDPAWHISSTVFDRARVWLVAGQIAVAVGARHAFGTGSRWTRDDLLLIGAVIQLGHLGEDDHLERPA